MSRVEAISASCVAEAAAHFKGVKEYSTYNILTDHDIFKTGEISQASVLIGCPLLIKRLRPSLLRPRHPTSSRDGEQRQGGKTEHARDKDCSYGYQEEGNYFPNEVAATLMMCCHDTGDGTSLSETPPRWADGVGTVLIARRDGQPLQALHIPIMLDFLRKAVGQGNMVSEADIKESLTPENFKHFYENSLVRLAEADGTHDWASVSSPFAPVVPTSAGVDGAGVAV